MRWPTWQLMLDWADPVPAKTRAASWPVAPWDEQPCEASRACAAVVTGVVQQPLVGSMVQLVCELIKAAELQLVAGSLRQSVESGPSRTLVTMGCT